MCGPCAVVQWLKILNLAVTHLSTRTIAGALKKATPVDHRSPHVCYTGPVLGEATMGVPLRGSARSVLRAADQRLRV